ncbi:MAG: response regulator, partial [Pseudomonadota bacterium]
ALRAAIVVIDRNRIIRTTNPAAERILGVGAREVGTEIDETSTLRRPATPPVPSPNLKFSAVWPSSTSVPRSSGDWTSMENVAQLDVRALNSPARVLLVEDNANNRKIVQNLLKRLGIEPVVAEDGAAAVEAFAVHKFDLILMDIQMPNMDGLEASRRIREMEEREGRGHTPIMAVTANALPEDRTACADAGMDDFIAKPVRRKPFLEAVDHWLQDGEEAASEPEAEPAPPILDGAVLDRLGRDVGTEVIPDLLTGFAEDLQAANARIEQMVENRDLDGLTRFAHTLKGSSSTFGAKRLAAVAKVVEAHGRGHEIEAMLNNLPALQEAITLTFPAIQAHR